MKQTSKWLVSQNKFQNYEGKTQSKTISIASGKGGVGKTSISIKIAKLLSKKYKTLLIDCDTNLSNTSIKLGLPITNKFYSLVQGVSSLDDCLHKDGNFHLLSACNGNMELFENKMELDKLIIEIISAYKDKYRYIILDCPADISTYTLNLNAYCDDRFIVVVPDKSSITDSYSLIKILAEKYGINENCLIVNKVSNIKQYQRIIKTLGDTVEGFIGGRIKILGSIPWEKSDTMESFDSLLLREEKSSIHGSFIKILDRYIEGLVVGLHMSHGQSLEKRTLAERKQLPVLN